MTQELINVYDSEVKALQETLATLNGRTYKPHDLEAFDREIVERCQDIGFVADVKWHTAADERGRPVEGTFIPVVEIVGRCEPIKGGEFDHDRMRHEVVNNVLDLPSEDAGVIKTPGEFHEHGPKCGH